MKMVCNESGDGVRISKLKRAELESKEPVCKLLRHVRKLEEMKAATKRRAERITLTLPRVKKLQEEETEDEKKLEKPKETQEELKLDDGKKLETNENCEGKPKKMKIKQIYCEESCIIYDSARCYPPEEVQDMKDWAQMAIDVFNQRQPIKYIVVDVIRAARLLTIGYKVHLLFTAKPDDDGDAITFEATIRCRLGRATGVTYLDIEK